MWSCTESRSCQIKLKGSSGKQKAPHLILPPGKSAEKQDSVVFQMKSDSGLSADELIQRRVEWLCSAMTGFGHVQSMAKRFQFGDAAFNCALTPFLLIP